MHKGNLMETNLVIEGFKFMGLGMGTVFIFLIIMIGAMNIMSTVIHRFFPEPELKATPTGDSTGAPKDNNNKVVAAITAAIKHHRKG